MELVACDEEAAKEKKMWRQVERGDACSDTFFPDICAQNTTAHSKRKLGLISTSLPFHYST